VRADARNKQPGRLIKLISYCALSPSACPGVASRAQPENTSGIIAGARYPAGLARNGERAWFFLAQWPLPKKGQRHTFATSAGKLTVVVTAAPASLQKLNIRPATFPS
jgi:hypothetical protein